MSKTKPLFIWMLIIALLTLAGYAHQSCTGREVNPSLVEVG